MSKVRIALLLVCVTALVAVSAFAAEFNDSWITAQRVGNPDAKIKLVVSCSNGYTPGSPYETQAQWARETYEAWARRHPDVQVEFQIRPDGQISNYMAKILSQAAVGRAPDVVNIDSFWVSNFTSRDLIPSIDKYMTEDEKNQYFDFTKKVTQVDGEQYVIWGETDARYLYYRKDWIPNPPETWDELIETAVKVSEEHDAYGFLVNAGHGEGAVNECTWAYFWAQGGNIFDENGRPIFGEGKNREIMINILNFDRRLIESGASPKMIASITGFDPILAEYKAGNAAMFIEGSWALTQLKDIDPELASKYAIAPYPQMEKGQRANSNGGWTWGILTDDPVKSKEAYDFVWECFTSKDAMAKRCQVWNYMPVRKDVFEDTFYFKTDPVQNFFAESLKYGRARPASPLYTKVSDSMATAVGNVMLGRKTAEEAIDEAYAEVLSAWKEQK